MANEEKLREYLRRATAELRQANRRLREAEAREQEPIAIVATSCHYPGGVRSPEDLRRRAAEGRDGIGDFPEDRGDVAELYDPDPDKAGKTYSREGGFLSDAGAFDPDFFGMR